MPPEIRKKRTVKTLAALLLSALVVAAAVLAPGFLLRWQDAGYTTAFNPMAEQGNRLDYNEDYYYAGAMIMFDRNSYYIDQAAYEASYEQMAQFRDETLPKQVDAWVDLGILPVDFAEYQAVDALYGGVEYSLRYLDTGVEPYAYQFVRMTTWQGTRNQGVGEFVIEQNRGKYISIGLTLPLFIPLLEEAMETDGECLLPYLDAYIEWMELDNTGDWREESRSAYHYENSDYYCFLRLGSEKAGIYATLALEYNSYDGTTYFRLNLESNIYF